MLWKKRLIYALEKEEKVSLSVVLRILTPCLFANPEIKCSKNSKNRTHTLNIVEVCYYIVGVVQRDVYSSICQNNSGKSTNSKQYQESLGKQHRSSQPQGTTIKGP